tara:strand:- start:18798 stop:20315 length:1518 start_codon:yes stop_codon:yes gene_type:complete
MSPTASNIQTIDAKSRRFGLRIESRLVQVAIAHPLGDGRFRLKIDQIHCEAPDGWLTTAGKPLLREALHVLVERHEMRRETVAISLDGDYCVSRIAMGTTAEVDRELKMLAVRVPRYLQLGPGEKAIGRLRVRTDMNSEYAVTGVVNRSLIENLYDALRSCDIDITWVEPSLVSLARLVGQSGIAGDEPILIADGTGHQWDVGISCAGRLLLDYRPAAATTEASFRGALDAHLSRLRRFCERHRGIASGSLDRLLLFGGGEKLDRAMETFGDSKELKAVKFDVPKIQSLYDIDESERDANNVAVVAAVLPLMIGESTENIPDLLETIRRAPDLTWSSKTIRYGWPAIAAILFLCISFGLVSQRRRTAATHHGDRRTVQASVAAAQSRMIQLAAKRERIGHLERIEQKSREADWNVLFTRVTQSLPDRARLNEFHVDTDGQIRLVGTVLDESTVYDLIGDLRKIPDVAQVALQGTSQTREASGAQFVVHLVTDQMVANLEKESRNE